MGWSKFFRGEPIPDRDDPKYQKRHEQMYSAGGTFARVTGLTWLGRKITVFANNHKGLYLALVFGIAIFVLVLQVYRFTSSFRNPGPYTPVSERVDSALQDRFKQASRTSAGTDSIKIKH